MMLKKIGLASLVAGFMMLTSQLVSATPSFGSDIAQIKSENAAKEVKKWEYLHNELTSRIEGSTTILNKFGWLMNKIALPTAIIGAAAVMVLDIAFETEARLLKFFKTKVTRKNAYIIPFIITHQDAVEYIGRRVFVSALVAKALGYFLEGKQGIAVGALNDYLSNWMNNKDNTPSGLIPLFEKLAKDYSDNGKVTMFTNSKIESLVEGLIANSFVIKQVV